MEHNKELTQSEFIISELSKEIILLKQELYATRYIVVKQDNELKTLKEKVAQADK